MPSAYKWFPISDFTGGRNAADDPLSLGENQVTQMRNGDTWRTKLFRKRGGSTAPSIGSTFTGVISSLIAHFPNNNPASAELWGSDNAATPIIGRMAAASTFSAPTLKDNPGSGAGTTMRGASYNGKLFLQYDSAVDRSHVYDPNLSSPSVRRVGLATPAAPSAANDGGAGTYPAVIRYYRQRYRIKHGSIVDAQSEPSPSVSFTPNGNDTGVVVTKATSISESETHWVIEASTDDVTFYELSEVVVGTTTYTDSALVATYADNDLSPVLGSYTVPASYKYVISAFTRMLWAGGWETGALQSSVFYTPAKGTSDKGDDERVPNTLFTRYRLDLGEGQFGDVTGFAGPMYGGVFIFKYSAIIKIIPTGLPSPVWERFDVSQNYGALEQECIAVGDLIQGARKVPAIFYLDAQVGPMVVGPVPPTEIGAGVRDLWDSVNLAATAKVGWVLDYAAKDQVFFAWATGSSNDPNVMAVYNKRSGVMTAVNDTGGLIRLARCAVTFARTPGATMSRDKVPYFGYSGANNTLLRGDTTDTSDNATTYQGLVTTRPLNFNNGKMFRLTRVMVIAKPSTGVTLTITADADFARETKTATISLTASASEASATRIIRTADLDLTDISWLMLSVGDSAAAANTWQIERLYIAAAPVDDPQGGVGP
jgi:hypothetical protein